MKKTIKLTIYLIIFVAFFSCASPYTYENEHQYYLGIRAAMAKDQYSLATARIIELEKDFSNSRYLCELYNIQIAWKNDQKLDVREVEEKYQKKCLNKR